MSDYVSWLRDLAEKGGKGVVNTIDARCLGRIADELERLSRNAQRAPSSNVAPTNPLSEKEHNALFARLLTSLDDMRRDRDEWKQQHENLLAMYRAALTSTPGQAAGKTDGGASTYCAHCDHEHQLHEDARGFHHVIKGERVPCCSFPPADGKTPPGHETCSACGRLFKWGETCTRGGCPCGGDV